MHIAELEAKPVDELRDMARELGIPGYSRLKKDDLVLRLLRANAEKHGLIFGGGVLEIVEDGFGFLRSGHMLPGPRTSTSRSRRSGASACAPATWSSARCAPPKDNEKYFGLLRVEAVNGLDPEVGQDAAQLRDR